MFMEALITFLIVLMILIMLAGATLSPFIDDIIDYLNKKNRK